MTATLDNRELGQPLDAHRFDEAALAEANSNRSWNPQLEFATDGQMAIFMSVRYSG